MSWADNLIPLRPSLSGPQLAGWEPGPPAMRGLGCRLLSDQRIDVEPGVALAPDVYIPRAAGRYPAVVSFAAYSKELHTAGVPTGSNEIGSPPVFTDRGYAHVVLSRRGMARSVGDPGVFLGDSDVADMDATIAWAAEQPWCNGDVVMFGTSYYGMTQPLIAVRRPPALRAFFCNEICTDYFRQLFQFGGVPQVQFANTWMGANFKREDYERRVAPVVRALVSQVLNSRLKSLWERELKKRMTRLMDSFAGGTPIREVREWYVNWLFDAKSRASSVLPSGPYAELAEITIPFVMVQNLGYFNLHQFGCYDLFENASTPVDRKWMILGPAEYELLCTRGSSRRSRSSITSCGAPITDTRSSRRSATGWTARTRLPARAGFRFRAASPPGCGCDREARTVPRTPCRRPRRQPGQVTPGSPSRSAREYWTGSTRSRIRRSATRSRSMRRSNSRGRCRLT